VIESRQPLILLTCSDTATFPSVWFYFSSVKGYAKSSAFATGKFALRALAQCNAREFGPQGIHVFHVIIDGSIDNVPLGEDREVKPGRLDSRAIARIVAQAVAQPRDTWMHEFDIRPSAENF
jgi:NAD(P)-dependent dehydrogenase (short-subunit alcohol dehydrogenase family)